MKNYYEQIKNILREADAEGLIQLGTPQDEYDRLAKDIAAGLLAHGQRMIDPDIMRSMISKIWARNFNLNDNDIMLRRDDIMRITTEIYSLFSE